MTKRIINKELLRERVKEIGLEMLAVTAECSASLIQKLVSEGYSGSPSLRTVDAICLATGDEMNDLFPIASQEEAS